MTGPEVKETADVKQRPACPQWGDVSEWLEGRRHFVLPSGAGAGWLQWLGVGQPARAGLDKMGTRVRALE